MALLKRHAAAAAASSAARGFSTDERRLLLSLPRIGPTVVARIEAQGVTSLQELQRRGVEQVVDEVCRQMCMRAWANRRSALAGALESLAIAAPADPAPESSQVMRGRTAA